MLLNPEYECFYVNLAQVDQELYEALDIKKRSEKTKYTIKVYLFVIETIESECITLVGHALHHRSERYIYSMLGLCRPCGSS